MQVGEPGERLTATWLDVIGSLAMLGCSKFRSRRTADVVVCCHKLGLGRVPSA